MKKFEITIRVLEGKLIRDFSSLLYKMSTYVTIHLEKGNQSYKTQSLTGKNPKWNEKFEFRCTEKGDIVDISIWLKYLLQADEKIGTLNLKMSMVEPYNTTDWFIICDDKQEQIGSILLNINS